MSDPNKCSSHLCENQIGPDAMEFTHKGEPAGGLCTACIEGARKMRVVFAMNDRGVLEAVESQVLG